MWGEMILRITASDKIGDRQLRKPDEQPWTSKLLTLGLHRYGASSGLPERCYPRPCPCLNSPVSSWGCRYSDAKSWVPVRTSDTPPYTITQTSKVRVVEYQRAISWVRIAFFARINPTIPWSKFSLIVKAADVCWLFHPHNHHQYTHTVTNWPIRAEKISSMVHLHE